MMRIFRAAAALLMAAAVAKPAAAQEIWRAVTEYPATAMPGEGLAHFAQAVGAATHGRVSVLPGYDGAGGLRSAAIPDAVADGRITVGDSFGGALAGLDPVFQLSSLPFLATSLDQARALLDAARPAYAAAFARHGQVLLYTTPWPPSGLWTRRPVTAAAGLQGLAIRTYDATSTAVLRDAGAAAVELSFAEVMPRLKDGSVEAVLSSGDGGAGRRLWDYLPNFTPVGYAMPLSFATVSRAALDGLDPDSAAAVLAAGRDTEASQWQAIGSRTARNEAAMRANGVTLQTADPNLLAALADAGRRVTASWEAGPGAGAAPVLSRYREVGR